MTLCVISSTPLPSFEIYNIYIKKSQSVFKRIFKNNFFQWGPG